MGLTLVTPPAAEPASLTEAKAQCRVEDTASDTYLTDLIRAATAYVERYAGISLITRTYRLTLDAFSDNIELPRGPVASISSITYVDVDGDQQTLSADYYTADLVSKPQWIVRNTGYSWPAVLNGVNAVAINYVAGAASLPLDMIDIKRAILLLVGHWYANREAVSVGSTATEVPLAVEALLQPYRMPVLA